MAGEEKEVGENDSSARTREKQAAEEGNTLPPHQRGDGPRGGC